VMREDGAFAVTRDGWPTCPLPHVRPHRSPCGRFCQRRGTIRRATPYLLGWQEGSLGIDCSGLVQVIAERRGYRLPARNSDIQQDSLGRALDASESKKIAGAGGPDIFWKGHVRGSCPGIADTIVHANAHHMATTNRKTPVTPIARIIYKIKARRQRKIASGSSGLR